MGRCHSNEDLRKAFEEALARCPAVQLCFVDHSALQVPEFAKPEPMGFSIFEYGLHLPLPILDLRVNERGVAATLSFACFPYFTFVPWEAAVGMRGWPSAVIPKSCKKSRLRLVP